MPTDPGHGRNPQRPPARQTPSAPQARRPRATRPSRAIGAPLVPWTKVKSYAQPIMTELRESALWLPALGSGSLGEPDLVERLDLPDTYYYIVPISVGSRQTARVGVDAKTGEFLEAGGIERPGQSLKAFVSVADALKKILKRRLTLPDGKRYVRAEALGHHPVLVWKPCFESMSPFEPFHQFSVGSTLVYVRVDGKFFARLTEPGPGS